MARTDPTGAHGHADTSDNAGAKDVDGGTDTAHRRRTLTRRVRFLVTVTIAYNLIEAVIALAAGFAASSAALVGFGLDSTIEVSSALAVAWQFAARDESLRRARERRALRVIALSFFALAAYVAVDALTSLVGAGEADSSGVGIALAAISVVVMPLLSYAERRTGRELGSATAVADSKQTLLCTYLSAALLIGLLANAVLGWGWADPVAALLIAGLAVREGIEAWRGDDCCGPGGMMAAAVAGDTEEDAVRDEGCADGCCDPER